MRRNPINEITYHPGYWLGLTLMLAGDILVIAALFTPWIEVYNNAPSLPIPRRGYSPWLALQRGSFDAFSVLVGAYFLLVLGFVVSTLVLARATSARFRVHYLIIALALVGLCLAGLALWGIPINLAFNYPYYDTNVVSGGFLAIAGFLCAIVGAVFVGIRRQQTGR
jgi:hypothetical protein